MYVMIQNGKLHTSKLQKQVSNRIFHKEENERERSYICKCMYVCVEKTLLISSNYDIAFSPY